MDIMIEYETECQLAFDYEKVIRDIVLAALEEYDCPYETEVSVTLTDNKTIHEVNRTYREIDRATDREIFKRRRRMRIILIRIPDVCCLVTL